MLLCCPATESHVRRDPLLASIGPLNSADDVVWVWTVAQLSIAIADHGHALCLFSFAQLRCCRSVAQSLTLPEILALARCSRITLAAIDSPVSFVFVSLTTNFPIPASMPVDSRLLRHVQLHLDWTFAPSSQHDPPQLVREDPASVNRLAFESHIDSLLHFARLRSAHGGGFICGLTAFDVAFEMSDAHWQCILSDPAMARLRRIRSHRYGDFAKADSIDPIPLLHLECLQIESFRGHVPLLRLIAHAPRLTSLCMLDNGIVTDDSQDADADEDEDADKPDVVSCDSLRYAGGCQSLTHLDLYSVCLFGSLFKRMFTGSLGRSLVSLSLDDFTVGQHHAYRAVPETDLTEAFTAMTRLQRLSLCAILRIDQLLPHVAAASVLQHLCIDSSGIRISLTIPSVDALRALLTRCASLQLVVRLGSSGQYKEDRMRMLAEVAARTSLGAFANRIALTDSEGLAMSAE